MSLRLVLGAAACKLWVYGENTEQAVAFRGEEHRWMWILNSREEDSEHGGVKIIVFSTNFKVSKKRQQRKRVTSKWTTMSSVHIRQLLSDTHRAFCDALLPLAHSDTFLQRGAFLQQQVPTTVWVPGPHTCSGGTKRIKFTSINLPCVNKDRSALWQEMKSNIGLKHKKRREIKVNVGR